MSIRHVMPSCRPRSTTAAVIALTAVLITGFVALVPLTAPAGAVSATQPNLVSAVPSAITPNINNGVVYALAQVGSTIVVGGSFTSATPHGSSTALTRNRILAFDQTTGAVSTTFAPSLDGTVNSIIPGPTAGTVYVGGGFTNVGTTKSKGLALLNLSNGSLVSGWKNPGFNGQVQDLRLTKNHLIVVGGFTTVGVAAHAGVVSLNATTGAVESYLNVQLTGHHNYNGSGANGAVGGRALDVSSDGTRAIVVGNFKMADGVVHDQIVMLDLGTSSGVVDPNWNTSQYSARCASSAFDTYVEDVDFSADGSYFAVAATGGSTFDTNADGTRSLCDTATRWSTTDTGTNVKPTWADYTGNDTFWSVAVTGTAIYVGGHQRWVNNPNGSDSAGSGSVPRPGIVALDPSNGLPYSWNPGRNPRGAGAYALLATNQGLYVGSDTDYFGNFYYKRMKIGYFPLAGGSTVPSTATASLPSNLYAAGGLPNSSNTNVLYRVDAGGPVVGAVDNGPDWMADGSDSDPGAQYRNNGSNTAGYGCCATLSSSVPSSTPPAIFNSERWSPGDNPPAQWTFPVTPGTHVAVRLYFANRYGGTSQAGQRVFDVNVDGSTFLDHYDIAADVGDQTGVMKEDDVVAPASGNITITETHETENPLINGIELIDQDAATTSTPSDLTYRPMTSSSVGSATTVPNTGIDWSSTRGAFVAGNYVFYGSTDGNFYKASFDGTHVGTPVAQDAYNDPAWVNVSTGSGQTYRGARPDFYNEISSVTGAFYSGGKMYYSLLGQSALYWRYFTPESGVIGATEYTVSGANFNNVAGMVLSGSTLYYANRSDGTLHSIPFANGTPDGSQDQTVNAPGVDFRARGLFLYGTVTAPNQPPTASATVNCTGLTCSFDGTGSTDPDGTVKGWSWDFGDGTSGTGSTVQHTYSTPGTYSASLTVTDDKGSASTNPWTGTATATNQPPTAAGSVSCNSLVCTFDGSNSKDPDGTINSYNWDFGDGTSGTGSTVQHNYTSPGTYNVSLSVTDNLGATSTSPWTGTASPTTTSPASVRYVGDSNFNGSTASPSVTAPSGVGAGDTEILFVSTGTSGVAGTPTGLAGWTKLTTNTNSVLETTVYTRTAGASDSGTKVTVPLSASTTVDLEFADYSGVASTTPVFTSAKDVSTATHVAPGVTTAVSGSWVLTYWSDRSSTTSAWTLPASVTNRKTSVGKGGGAVSGVVTDSNAGVPVGSYPARTATSNTTSGRGNEFSIVLAPGN